MAITSDKTHSPERDDRRHQPLAYVTNDRDNTVSVIDTASNKVVATVPLGNGPTGVAITPDGTHAYVTNLTDGTVSVIDAASNVVATIPVGAGPIGVAITPDGAHPSEHDDRGHQPLAYVTNLRDSTVSVIDTASNNVVATIPVRPDPNGVAITPDGTLAYVTTFFNAISVIGTASNTVVATIPAGPLPEGVAFATVTPSHRSSEQ